MLQPRASLFGVAIFFICQCRYVLGRSLKSNPSQDVSNADAADWLEKALWGRAGGASRWRKHGFLHTHRLRLKRLQFLHVLPSVTPAPPSTLSAAPTQPYSLQFGTPPAQLEPPPPNWNVTSDAEIETDFNDDAGEDDEQDTDADENEDMLSAGLENLGHKKEEQREEHIRKRRAARRKRRAAKARRKAHAHLVRLQGLKRRRSADDAARSTVSQAASLQNAGKAVTQMNGMLKTVVEEMELEKSRCQMYMCTARKEASDAREISTDDQERFARMDTILHSSQAESDDIEGQMSDLGEQLKRHKARCLADLGDLRSELTTLKTDSTTTAKIMKASPCKGQALLLECQHQGSRKSFIESRHRGLRQVMAQLSTSTARRSLQHSLRRSVAHKRRHDLALLQSRTHHRRLRHGTRQDRGAHEAEQEADRCRAAKMDCKLVETAIVLMMADVQDKQHTTKVDLDKTNSQCNSVTTDLEEQISHLEGRKEMIGQQVAQTMAERSGLGSEASVRLQDYDHITKGLADITKECDSSIKAYDNQACTLRRSRTDVLVSNDVKFTDDELNDCEVSPWAPAETCSESCGGGVQRLIRTVILPAGKKGMPCPDLETQRACNVQSCPLNCKVSEWTPWTQCSALCGGGTRYRSRRLVQMAQHGGELCPGENGNSEACNTQPCVQDCVLGAWTPWGGCSRACNGGYQRRKRSVSAPATGNAACPSEEQNSEYLKCKKVDCPIPKVGETLKCASAVDVIIILDGSASLGKTDFADVKVFATSLIKALNLGEGKGQAAVVLAGGPKAWADFEKCKLAGSSTGALGACNIAVKAGLSAEESTATGAVAGMSQPGGPAYTAGALSLADGLVEQSRPGAKPVVLVVGHSRPLSESRTSDEAANIRAKARLMWLVVAGAHPEKDAEQGQRRLSVELAATFASRPYSDNIFQADTFKELTSFGKVSEVVSAVCPAVEGTKK